MKKKMLAYPYLIWMVIFIVVPMLLILGYSFISAGTGGTMQLTLQNITQCFRPEYLRIMWISFELAGISTILCLLIGYPLALILSGATFKNKDALVFLLLAPMWMNFLLRTYAWLTLLERNGVINSFLKWVNLPTWNVINTPTAVMIGMIYNFLPFMVLPIYTVMSKIDGNLIEAARDLGADKWGVFRKVIFPWSLAGVFSGIIMVFMPAVTTFVIPNLLGGAKTMMIGSLIEMQFFTADRWGFGSALSAVIMVIMILVAYFANRRGDIEESGGGLL